MISGFFHLGDLSNHSTKHYLLVSEVVSTPIIKKKTHQISHNELNFNLFND